MREVGGVGSRLSSEVFSGVCSGVSCDRGYAESCAQG